MKTSSAVDRLQELRRDLHRHPEPAWCEYYTTGRIIEELRRIDVDSLSVGSELLSEEHLKAVPDRSTREEWYRKAQSTDLDEDVLDILEGELTGVGATIDGQDGTTVRGSEAPTVALRVDIDALPVRESTDADHRPMADGFRSENGGFMHACGHDAHVAIGLGVAEAAVESTFDGTLKLYFQPAEERGGGGKPLAEGGHLDDVEYLFGVHVGLGLETGVIVPRIDTFLSIASFEAEFRGEAAHSALTPEGGNNAVQALSSAIQSLYSIPRHSTGGTRINVGSVSGGTASNVIPESASMSGEVRAESERGTEYMQREAIRRTEAAARTHGCTSEIDFGSVTPSADCDDALADVVRQVATSNGGVDRIASIETPLWSEDVTHLIGKVQRNGGLATYVGVGADNPSAHHTPTFDVDERAIALGTTVLVDAIELVSTLCTDEG